MQHDVAHGIAAKLGTNAFYFHQHVLERVFDDHALARRPIAHDYHSLLVGFRIYQPHDLLNARLWKTLDFALQVADRDGVIVFERQRACDLNRAAHAQHHALRRFSLGWLLESLKRTREEANG